MTATEHTIVTSSHQKARARDRIVAVAIVTGAVVVGALGTASSVNANADYYVALAYSFESDVPGLANNFTDGGDPVRFAALKNCQDDNDGNHCEWFGTFRNECAALAVLGARDWVTGTGFDLRTAEQHALAANPGSRIAASGCARSLGHRGPLTTAPTHTVVPLP